MSYFTIEGRALAEALKITNAIVERRSTHPILSCVRITFNDRLTLEGTDLDREVKVSADEIDGEGELSICVNAHTLAGIAHQAGSGVLKIERVDHPADGPKAECMDAKITLGEGEAVYEINGHDPNDFPTMDNASRVKLIERFTNGMLSETLGKVSWCVSKDETRYYLNGVCWQMNNSRKRFVATDGHRMAICQYSGEAGGEDDRIIPRRTAVFISRFFRGCDVEIFSTHNPNIIEATTDGLTLKAKMIDGKFPDVDRIIPAQAELVHTFSMPREEMMSAIRRASAVGDFQRKRSPAVRFFDDGGKMALEHRNQSMDKARVKTTVDWANKAQPFGFNGSYMLEIAGHCQGKFKLGFRAPDYPFLITDDDETMTRVIMPMRVG